MWWQRNKISFFDHFESHVAEVLSAAQLLNQLFTGSSAPVEIARQIKGHEHTADQVAHAVFNQLNASFIYPIDREDILALTKTLDDVIDDIHHSAEAFALIFELPAATSYARRFSEAIVKASENLTHVCPLLRKPSRHRLMIKTLCVEIHRLENEADDLYREALHTLFGQLKDEERSVAEYLAWSDIYAMLERVTDKAEDCANIAEQIAMKYS